MKVLFASIAATCLWASAIQAASVLVDDFDAGLDGWTANTTETNVRHLAFGGNPGGFLLTDNIGPSQAFGTIGATNADADHSGVLADGVYTVSVDLAFGAGDFDEARLRWRAIDSSFNGWYYVIEDSLFASEWTSYSVSFDTTWDDATALSNGWVQETSSVPFATLWDDIYTSEVRLTGTGEMVAGIDNYSIGAGIPAIPLPATAGLLALALSGFGLARLTRRRASS